MGREFPQGDGVAVMHPFLAMTFFLASVAATMAVVTSLCGTLSRKKSAPSPDSPYDETKESRDGNIQASSPTDVNNQGFSPENDDLLQQPLPPPPGKRNLTGAGAASYHFRSSSSASTSSVASQMKKLPASMSMRALGNGIGIGIGMTSRQTSKKDLDDFSNDHHRKKDKKLKHEDSIWKKTIILGEKCKVPDEDDEDTILYDEKGNRIPTYHHRRTTSAALSRQNSNVDHEAIPSLDQGHNHDSIKSAFAGKH